MMPFKRLDRAAASGERMRNARLWVTEESSFVVLRALAMLGGMVAILLVPHPPEHRLLLRITVWIFIAYKALLFVSIRVWPRRLRTILLGTTILDLLFVSMFVWLGGGFESHFYLLFYLLVAVTAVHFGPGAGFWTAGGASALYALASLEMMHHLTWNHFASRVAPLFLLGGSLGYLGRWERTARTEAERLNWELKDHQTRLERAYRELQSAQARLVQSERLATIGQMSAKVSHEVRNPLSSISLNVELLEDEVASLPVDRRTEMIRLLGAIRSQIDVLGAVTEEYLRFARLPKPKLEAAALPPIIADFVDFMREELRARGVELVVEVSDDIPTLRVDAGQIRQVLLNLVRNAAEAMSEGGTIRLAVEKTDAERQRCRGADELENERVEGVASPRPSAPAPLRFVEVAVTDTGVGIPREDLERIFEPFFTSKEGGTGLGLPISRQIALEHGGTLRCESVPGHGTTFRLTLPISDEESSR
jgi:signal transduction histidine kinase